MITTFTSLLPVKAPFITEIDLLISAVVVTETVSGVTLATITSFPPIIFNFSLLSTFTEKGKITLLLKLLWLLDTKVKVTVVSPRLIVLVASATVTTLASPNSNPELSPFTFSYTEAS